MRACVGVREGRRRGLGRGQLAGLELAGGLIPGIPRSRDGRSWSCPRGAEPGAALAALMAKLLTQPCGGEAPRTARTGSAEGERGAERRSLSGFGHLSRPSRHGCEAVRRSPG